MKVSRYAATWQDGGHGGIEFWRLVAGINMRVWSSIGKLRVEELEGTMTSRRDRDTMKWRHRAMKVFCISMCRKVKVQSLEECSGDT